jgi:hypothetical protein
LRKRGIAIILGTFALAGLLFVLWLVGLITHIGGGLIHLLLLLAIVIVPLGVVAGVIFLVLDSKQDQIQR